MIKKLYLYNIIHIINKRIIFTLLILVIFAQCSPPSPKLSYWDERKMVCNEIYQAEKEYASKIHNNSRYNYDNGIDVQSCPNPTYKYQKHIKACEDIYKQPMNIIGRECTGSSSKKNHEIRLSWDQDHCMYLCKERCRFLECKEDSIFDGFGSWFDWGSKPKKKEKKKKETTYCRTDLMGNVTCNTYEY